VPVTDFEPPGAHVDRVYEQYRDAIHRFFERKTRSSAAAKDLTQAVYLRVLNYPSLGDVREPKKFIYKVAWNVLRTEIRRSVYDQPFNVRITESELEATVAANRNLWVDDSTAEIDEEYFKAALARLTPDQRKVFILHHIDGLTVEQISLQTTINPNTVKKYLRKAWARLRSSYGDDPQPER
jgi:RNA polymerase sigma factor (sigma-70 family)